MCACGCGFQQAYSQYIPATRAQVSGAQGGQTGVAMDGTYLVEASFWKGPSRTVIDSKREIESARAEKAKAKEWEMTIESVMKNTDTALQCRAHD